MEVFAKHVRQSLTARNRNGNPHTERRVMATMPYVALENPAIFHVLAEETRLLMLERLRDEGAPINVWRTGQIGGIVASTFDVVTGEAVPWKDEHRFLVRTRLSVEREPFDPLFVSQDERRQSGS